MHGGYMTCMETFRSGAPIIIVKKCPVALILMYPHRTGVAWLAADHGKTYLIIAAQLTGIVIPLLLAALRLDFAQS